MAISLDVATAKPVQLLLLNQKKCNIQQLTNELKSIEIFFKGFNEQSFNKIIWIESTRNQIKLNNPNLFKNNSSISIIDCDPITYFTESLNLLNNKLSQKLVQF